MRPSLAQKLLIINFVKLIKAVATYAFPELNLL